MVQEEIMRRGPWTEEEDVQLLFYVKLFGDRRWDFLAKVSGLKRTGKSCRLRWVNYLNPDLKHGKMTPQEERLVLELHSKWGNRWSRIARKIPGRTDNEIKNYWRTHMRKKAQEQRKKSSVSPSSSSCSSITHEENKRNFYDTGGLKLLQVEGEKKSSDQEQDGKSMKVYSMDEIWKDIELLGEKKSSDQEQDGMFLRPSTFLLQIPSQFLGFYSQFLPQMSASTVSISANPATASTRRRAVEKKQPTALDLADSNLATATAVAAAAAAADPISTPNVSYRSDSRDAIQVVKKTLPHTNVPTSSTRRPSGSASAVKKHTKTPKPRWLTVVSVVTKNLLLVIVLIGLVQMVRRLVGNSYQASDSDGLAVISGDFDGKFAEMESFVKKTTKMMQVQIDVIDQKLDTGIRNMRDELSVKMDDKVEELQLKLKEVSGTSENLEKLMGEFREKNWVSRDEVENMLEEYRKMKGSSEVDDKSLDEFRVYARQMVEKEIEKHAADGLGRVDYALSSGGARVVKHSEPFITKSGSGDVFSWLTNRNAVSNNAVKILTPSFGEPGQCFALKGDSGFVQIRLRTAIIPEAVTLEHVAKSVAYDRSSAPKNGRISGWLHNEKGTDLAADSEKMFLLTEFMYDLDKSNAQTFDVLESAGSNVVDTIRFDFTSNHGQSHTCIYRLRVHGREPSSLVMQS